MEPTNGGASPPSSGPSSTGSPDRPRFDVFLSYNSEDREQVRYVAEKLRTAGVRPWVDGASLSPGGDYQRELADGLDDSGACAVFVGQATGGLRWSGTEVRRALNHFNTDPNYRVFAVLLPGIPLSSTDYLNRLPPFLKDVATVVDLRRGPDHEASFRTLILAIKGLPFDAERPAIVADAIESPYRGLFPFAESESGQFFGRSTDLGDLQERLDRRQHEGGPRFLSILGPSGSGKSSLMRAGLLSALHDGALPGSQTWPRRVLRPKTSPLRELATALQPDPALADPASVLRYVDALRARPDALDVAVRSRLHTLPPDARFIVAIDQFEETFTLCTDESERTAFVEALAHAATVDGGVCIVVLTLRSDFIDHGTRFPALADLLNKNVYFVPPLAEAGLREAIERPAQALGVRFEPGLVDTIVPDVHGQSGALPLLQFAMRALWERDARSGVLTLDGYVETGGVHEAVARHADAVYASLPSDQQVIARRVLLRLTEPGPGVDHTRRRVSLTELEERAADQSERAALDQVLAVLVDARLITTDRDAVTQAARLEVSHEALIRGWGSLKTWIEAERETLVRVGRIRDAALEWERLGHDEGLLFRGARLAEVRAHQAALQPHLSETERDFLDASLALARREQAARDRARRRVVVSSVLVAAVALVLMSIALYQWQRAESARAESQEQTVRADGARKTAEDAQQTAKQAQQEALSEKAESDRQRDEAEAQRRRSVSRSLAAPALTHVSRRLDQALLLAEQAMGVEPTFEARYALFTTLREVPGFAGILRLPGATSTSITAIAINPTGALIAVAIDSTILVWDTSTRQAVGTPFTGHTQPVEALAFSPDGATVASIDRAGDVLVWDAQSGTQRRLAVPPMTSAVESIAFSSDGRRLRIARSAVQANSPVRQLIQTWNLDADQLANQLVLEQGLPGDTRIDAMSLSLDGQYVAAALSTGEVSVWSVDDDSMVGQVVGHATDVRALAFRRDNARLAIVDGQKEPPATLQVVTIPEGHSLGSFVELREPETDVVLAMRSRFAVAFSADGSHVMVRSDRHLFESNTMIGEIVRRLFATDEDDPSVVLGVSADGSMLAIRQANQLVLIRPAQDALTSLIDIKDVGRAAGVSFSSDGRYLIGVHDRFGDLVLVDAATHQEVKHKQWLPASSNIVATVSPPATPDRVRLISRRSGPRSTVSPFILSEWTLSTNDIVELGALPSPALLGSNVSFSADGQLAATRRGSGEIDLVRLDDRALVRTIRARPAPRRPGELAGLGDAVISPDGRLVAACDNDTLTVWDVASGAVVVTVPVAANDPILGLAFNPTGTLLAIGWGSSPLELRDLTNPRRTRRALEERDRVKKRFGGSTPTFSPDGTILAVSGSDGVLLWDVTTSQQLGERFGSSTGQHVRTFRPAWSPDGRMLVVSGGEPSINLVSMDPADWRRAACSMAGRDLTEDEWLQYLPDEPVQRSCGQ